MSELLESIAVPKGSDKPCPFPHYPVRLDLKNNWNNDSTELADNLDDASKSNFELHLPMLRETTFMMGPNAGRGYTCTYNPHHILPGGASWPKTTLKKWAEKTKGHVRGNIEYDVNCYENGIDLPSSNAFRGNWTAEAGRTANFQRNYAFAAMQADTRTRQFHDAHKAYSAFATKVMNKVSSKLDERPAREMGCDDEDCQAGKKRPFAPPIGLRARIHAVSGRLSRYLWGHPSKWRKPIFTSRFAIMFQRQSFTQDAARAALKESDIA